jgi:hypothetical protein
MGSTILASLIGLSLRTAMDSAGVPVSGGIALLKRVALFG